MVLREMYDAPQRFTVVKLIQEMGTSRKGADADLNPCITGQHLGLWYFEVFHDAEAFRIRTEPRMPEIRTGILISVGNRQFVAEGVLFQEAESVADTNIVVCFGIEPGPDKVRAKHDP